LANQTKPNSNLDDYKNILNNIWQNSNSKFRQQITEMVISALNRV